MKKRRAMRPSALFTVPARKVGIAPANRSAANVYRGPTLSHIGPAMRRTSRVAVKAMMLEFATSYGFKPRSFAMTSCRSGGKAYHDQKAIMN